VKRVRRPTWRGCPGFLREAGLSSCQSRCHSIIPEFGILFFAIVFVSLRPSRFVLFQDGSDKRGRRGVSSSLSGRTFGLPVRIALVRAADSSRLTKFEQDAFNEHRIRKMCAVFKRDFDFSHKSSLPPAPATHRTTRLSFQRRGNALLASQQVGLYYCS
jgi:hypothetical protein